MLHWFAKRMREMQEVRRDERGFTLIELLVVVIIIGILAAIAIPAFLANRERAQDAAVQADLRNAGSAATICFTETSNWGSCDSDAELDPYGFNQSANVTTTYAVAGGVLTITGVHTANAAASGTWDSASGNYTQT